ncbi:protein serine/threonine kinase, putative [Entamoeba invadens IP1]|uniref:Protein serine/threonine kinase, putative n=1 Tax=Entamoeba invadens IP1 TaxID=370355 RepID=A0A0A1TWW7_ENTIV|nr:protein serine/threonine kinase, putative [Entamoeba invadens IP1]ELP83812.1 protein serine/threonine kinase, putative [Entamoeba invadens IP1]|eukprot:XP_004183158.1 protein serine/threonine kinase, putative [Entamoeba invadens IP1]
MYFVVVALLFVNALSLKWCKYNDNIKCVDDSDNCDNLAVNNYLPFKNQSNLVDSIVCEKDVFLYVEVSPGNFTFVEFLKSNSIYNLKKERKNIITTQKIGNTTKQYIERECLRYKCGGEQKNGNGCQCLQYNTLDTLKLDTICNPNCKQCAVNDRNYCTECKTGGILNGGTCLYCQNCAVNQCVNQFDGGWVCSSCNSGYFLQSLYCFKCADKCGECSGSSTSCTTCASGYYYSSFDCVKCEDKCASGHCKPNLKCDQCVSHYYLDSSMSCQQCSSACGDCTNYNYCTTCPNTNQYIQNGVCNNCNTGCTSCYGGLNGQCYGCNYGYYRIKSGSYQYRNVYQCVSCSYQCIRGCDGINACSWCNNGFYEYGGTCHPCYYVTNCAQGCLASQNSCTNCNSGYYAESGTCHSCTEINNCNTSGCSTTSRYCNTCNNNYFAEYGKCLSCTTIEGCTQNGCLTISRYCNNCIMGYFFENGKCLNCTVIANCDKNGCSKTNRYCNTCTNGFVASNGACVCPTQQYQNTSNSCRKCYEGTDNCKSCTSTSTYQIRCNECFYPFELEGGRCVSCTTGMYFNNQTKTCVNNNVMCVNNIDATTCVKCKDNGFMSKHECIIPSTQCLYYSISNCENCQYGISVGSLCENKISQCKYNIQHGSTETCLYCADNWYVNNNTCSVAPSNLNTRNGYLYQCGVDEYKDGNNNCEKCATKNAVKCSFTTYQNLSIHVYYCEENHLINYQNEECFSDDNCIQNERSDCTRCRDTNLVIKSNKCTQCTIIPNCELYKKDCTCLQCKDNFLLVENECIAIEELHCEHSNKYTCLQCFPLYNTNNNITNIENDKYCVSLSDNETHISLNQQNIKTIFECDITHFLFDNSCELLIQTNIQHIYHYTTNIDHKEVIYKTTHKIFNLDNKQESLKIDLSNCKIKTPKGCVKCNDGFYLENTKCVNCKNNCLTCSNTTNCLSCDFTQNLLLMSGNVCQDSKILLDKCYFPMAGNTGCAICRDGYYYHNKDCIKCDSSCSTCKNAISCDDCADDYYLYAPLNPLCQSYDTLIGCTNKTKYGCKECEEGYFLNFPIPLCVKCLNNCTSCEILKSCILCSPSFVLKNEICVSYTEIPYCVEAFNNLCTKCEEKYKPSDDGLSCKKEPNLALIISLPVVFFLLLVIFIATTIVIIFFLYLHLKEKKKMINVCIFPMKKSNIHFFKINEWLVSNKKVLEFENNDTQNESIPVDKETRELLCVGNKSKNRMKIQFSVIKGCDYYEIRTEPKLVNLKSGEACEFEVFLTPLCSCNIEEKIVCIGLDIKKGVEMTEHIQIKAKTEMTTKLDYHELKEIKKLGEGSFGIVYLGDFRGDKVAIKRLKEGCETQSKVKEFEKEVSMLDKFRCEYIVHFYGAVFIPSRICMVTEFAQFGSLNDFMKKRKEQAPRSAIKAKFMLDMAKGISYLHHNGIVHRDIKPDNLLVFSLEMNEKVNAKMTDFGSARNINMMMTNMTFTKGIGTPKYMSPEVLNKEKYKMPSDIFSFAITMYETFTWKEPYPKSEFKFAWSIADFVSKGNHLKKGIETDDKIYSLLDKMWCFEFKDRIKIDEVVEELEDYMRFYEN